MAKENVTQDSARGDISHKDLDFGTGAARVGLALEATSQANALVSLLMQEKDSDNLMECMSILGPKLIELFSAQYSALSDSLATVASINGQLGRKEVINA